MLRAVPSFGLSICILSVVQGALVALPAAREIPALARLRSGWWALVPVGSVVAFVFGARALAGVADGLTYLALIAVPPLAAAALGWAMRGARPLLALAVVPLFALAWADGHGLAGEAAAVALDGLSCVTLGVLLVAVTPRVLIKIGIVAMAAADTWLVVSDLLQAPNNALNLATPVAHLPQLQSALFGSAVIGYGDLFIAALFGALLARSPRLALRGALAVTIVSLASNALFLAVNELPATVPVALVLLAGEVRDSAARRRGRGREVREDATTA
jgi:hypothetical protein